MKKYLIIILIVFIAGFLRFWHLGLNPPSLTWDEAAWGYNAYSLSLDGKDEFGRFLPLDYLESFGDFKPPVYAYLDIIPVKLFGLTEYAVRFPSALFGTLTVLIVYVLVNELFIAEKKLTIFNISISFAQLVAFILAISPWHIMLSRVAFEANIASFFIISGITFFLLAINKKGWLFVLAALCFALSIATFNTARIVSPLLLVVLTIGFYKKIIKNLKWVMLAIIVGLIISVSTISFMFKPQSKLRFQEVNIFSDPVVIQRSVQEVENDNNAWWSKIIHNRRWEYTRSYVKHYLDHFNPGYLFIKGDGNPKFSTQDVGELYLWEAPFLIIGMILLFKHRRGYWWLIPIWLLIGIIPAATARETPHALRTETSLPTWQILVAYGIWVVLERINKIGLKKIFQASLLLVIIIFFVYFQHGYWYHYPQEFASEWQYGYKDSIEYIQSISNKYSEINFTESLGRPYIYFLFYMHTDPELFRETAIIERDAFGFVNVRSIGKYHFGIFANQNNPSNTLYIDDSDHIPNGAEIVKEFYLPDGKTRLKAYEI